MVWFSGIQSIPEIFVSFSKVVISKACKNVDLEAPFEIVSKPDSITAALLQQHVNITIILHFCHLFNLNLI